MGAPVAGKPARRIACVTHLDCGQLQDQDIWEAFLLQRMGNTENVSIENEFGVIAEQVHEESINLGDLL